MGSAISSLIVAAEQGDRPAAEALFAALYSELHRLAKCELAATRLTGELERHDPPSRSVPGHGCARRPVVSRPGAIHGVCGASDARTDHRPCPRTACPEARRPYSRLLRWTPKRWRTRWITESLSESVKRLDELGQGGSRPRRDHRLEILLRLLVCGNRRHARRIRTYGAAELGESAHLSRIAKFAQICRSEESRCPHSAPISGRL